MCVCVCVCLEVCSSSVNRSVLLHLVHDVSRLYALLLLRTNDADARKLLIATAEQLHKFVMNTLPCVPRAFYLAYSFTFWFCLF